MNSSNQRDLDQVFIVYTNIYIITDVILFCVT